jgi:RNA polymerase sigma factor (sigma-70 family)
MVTLEERHLHAAVSQVPSPTVCSLTQPTTLTDEELMSALCCEQGRELFDDLFAEVFRRYHPRVRSLCLQLTGDQNRAVDLAQEVFFKAYSHIQTFRGEARFSTWLYSITRNHCLNAMKQRTAEHLDLSEIPAKKLQDTNGMEAYKAIEEQQSCDKLWQLINRTLDPTEARVMTLHYAEDVPLRDITRDLTLTNRSGAKAYIVSARRKLNRALRRRRLNDHRDIDASSVT